MTFYTDLYMRPVPFFGASKNFGLFVTFRFNTRINTKLNVEIIECVQQQGNAFMIRNYSVLTKLRVQTNKSKNTEKHNEKAHKKIPINKSK